MLAGTGTLAVGGTALMAIGSEPVRAEVTTGELDVPDAEHIGKDGSVEDIQLSVSGNWSFSTNGADAYSIDLAVAPAPETDNWQSIDWIDGNPLANSTGGTYELGGSILQHDAIEAGDFNADAAETTSRDIPIQVLLTVRNGDETVAEAIAETVATVTIENETIAVSAEVVGDGSIDIQM